MSKIEDKYNQLKSSGLDLGSDQHPGKPDMDAGFGGTYRQYKNGNIYFHPGVSPDAHEVHGGILSLYLAHNGPGTDTATGKRFFGFPKADSLKSANQTPKSDFEFGAIYWTQGTGGVVLTGAAYQAFLHGGVSAIGLPLTSNIAVAGGEAIYCERGIAWATPAVAGGSLVGYLAPPLLGTPAIIDPTPAPPSVLEAAHVIGGPVSPITETQPFLSDFILYRDIPAATCNALLQHQPNLFAAIGAGRFSLINTGARTNRIALDCVVTKTQNPSPASVSVTCKLVFETSATALDNTLYDLELAIPKGSGFYPLSPHSVYLKKDWTDFGLLHITDIHLSLRNENLRAKLQAAGLTDAAQHYANCQDQFRDFIHYANHLHSIGLAHGIMATGDLVDYYLEPGDDPTAGNFQRMRNMILGKPFDTGVRVGEELLLPIFTTFGNHDHRLNDYPLKFAVDVEKDAFNTAVIAAKAADDFFEEKGIPFVGLFAGVVAGAIAGFVSWFGIGESKLTFTVKQFDTFDLKEDEVDKLQGSTPTYGTGELDQLLKSLFVGSRYPFFEKYFGSRDNKIALGPHRLVLLDSGPDIGVPASASDSAIASLLINYLRGNIDPNTLEIESGCPNSVGYSESQFDLIREAIAETTTKGLVILGVHLPPVAPTHGYNDYCRETEHPTADPANIPAYVSANSINPAGWQATGTPYFKTGDVKNSLDYGIGVFGALDLLKICAGVGLDHPVDLLLCGHHHDRIEYRVRWNASISQLEYYTDFYTENPTTFSSSRTFAKVPLTGEVPSLLELLGVPKADLTTYQSTLYRIVVDPRAPLGGTHSELIDAALHPPKQYDVLTVPPYANPLNSTSNVSQWWQAHRPLLMQTAALGPIDPRQRYDDELADPTFQGFRLMVVRDNTIQKIHYVTIHEMRAANFVLPFEAQDTHRGPIVPVVPINPVLASHDPVPAPPKPVQEPPKPVMELPKPIPEPERPIHQPGTPVMQPR